MGTYTTHYNLYMPSIGEQGWGDLVNGNFSTIDTTMDSLNTRLTAVENEVNGDLNCTSVTTSGTITANGGIETKALTSTSISNSGTITSTGLITANGGITGNLIGNVTGDVAGYLIRTRQETGSSSGNSFYYTIPVLTLANNVIKEVTYSKPQYIISSNDIIKYIVSGGNLSGTIKFTVKYNRTSWNGKGSQSSNDTLKLEITLYDENNTTLATTTLTNTIVVNGYSTQTTQTLYSAVSYNYAYWNKVKYIKAYVKSLVLTDTTLASGATVNDITTTALNSYVKA